MVKSIPLQYDYLAVDTDANLAHVLEKRRAVIFYSDDGVQVPFGSLGKRKSRLMDIIAFGAGNYIAMRVELGESQEPVQPFHQFFRFDVFQLLRDIVYLIPAEAQLIK